MPSTHAKFPIIAQHCSRGGAGAAQVIMRRVDLRGEWTGVKGVLEEPSLAMLPLLALPDAHTPELIGALADPEESRTSPDTTR